MIDERELMEIRRHARRNTDLASGPVRLFSEIVDLHLLDDGCFAGDTQLGAWLGVSSRSVRRWRRTLEQHGYINVREDGDRRHLIPSEPDGQSCRTELSDKSGQRPNVSDTSGQQAPDKSVQHRELDNPAEAGEGAPAHEDPEGDELFERIVDVYRDVVGGLTRREEQKLIRLCDQLDGTYKPTTVASALREDLMGTDTWSVGVFVDSVLPKYARSGGKPKKRSTGPPMSGMRDFSAEVQKEHAKDGGGGAPPRLPS